MSIKTILATVTQKLSRIFYVRIHTCEEGVRSLIRDKTITKISCSFEVNIDMEGPEQFFPVIEGVGWVYLPTESRSGEQGTILVPDKVIKVFPKQSAFFVMSEKHWLKLFQNIFNSLKQDGYEISISRNPKQALGRDFYAKYTA